jgi:hypothetical protein
VLSQATVFGGGVFLGAAFMHLLSEASETMSEQKIEFPLAELLACVGFLAIFAFEEICSCECFFRGAQGNDDGYAALAKMDSVDEMQVVCCLLGLHEL